MFSNKTRTALCAFAVAALGACSNQGAQTGGERNQNADAGATGNDNTIEVVIGTANALTGPFAHWGKDAANGVQLAIDEANRAKYDWNGKTVVFKMVSEDDQGDPKTAGQVAQRFVDMGAKAIVGHLTTGPSKVASGIYNENGIPEIVYSVTGNDFMDQGFPMLFRVMASDKDQGLKLSTFAKDKLGMKTFIDVHDKTPYGEGLADDFSKEAEKLGATHVTTEYTTNSATEFGAIVTNIKRSNPDVVFYGGMDAQAAPLVRELRQQGVKSIFIGADGVFTPKFIELSGDSGAGSYSSATGAARELMPGFKEFDEKYRKAFNEEVNQYSPYAYDATRIMINAMNEAKSAEAKDFVPLVKKTHFTGVTGEISFKDNGDIANPIVTIYKLVDGKWTVVRDQGDQEASADQAAAEQAPAEQAPAEQAPAEQAPAEQAPAEQAPAEQAPAEQAPAEQAPAEQAPAEQAPAEQAPAEQAPAEQAPAEQAPAEQTPAEQAPAEQAPAEQAPAEQAPAEQAPAEQAPAEQAPAEQAPAEQAPATEGAN